MGVCNCSMFCCTLLYFHSSIAIILMGKRELIALLNLSSWCLVMVERLFLAVLWGCNLENEGIIQKVDHSDWATPIVAVPKGDKVSKIAKIRNRYNQVPHLTQDTNGKVTNSQKTPQTRAKRSALSQQVTTKHI